MSQTARIETRASAMWDTCRDPCFSAFLFYESMSFKRAILIMFRISGTLCNWDHAWSLITVRPSTLLSSMLCLAAKISIRRVHSAESQSQRRGYVARRRCDGLPATSPDGGWCNGHTASARGLQCGGRHSIATGLAEPCVRATEGPGER